MYTTLAIAATIRVDIVIYINKLKNKAKLASIPRHRFGDRDTPATVCCCSAVLYASGTWPCESFPLQARDSKIIAQPMNAAEQPMQPMPVNVGHGSRMGPLSPSVLCSMFRTTWACGCTSYERQTCFTVCKKLHDVCLYVCTHACMLGRIDVCMYTRMLVFLYVCMCACKNACMYV